MQSAMDIVDIESLDSCELSSFLLEVDGLNISQEDCEELEDRGIDGKAFIQLTREDFAVIYPSKQKFLLSSKLYRISQQFSQQSHKRSRNILEDTDDLLGEMSELNRSGGSIPSSSRDVTPLRDISNRCSPTETPLPKRKRPNSSANGGFRLPCFSPDLKLCIQKDSFYTSTQRNKLIKEGCIALRGHCWEQNKVISNEDKRKLAVMLHNLAPKSLGDYNKSACPESGIYGQVVRWFQNHSYSEKKLCQTAKKSKPTSSETQDGDDAEAIEAHLLELNKEMRRKKFDKEKVSRLLSHTYSHRNKEMLSQPANVRIGSALQKYPCLHNPVYLLQEMFLSRGLTINGARDVKLKQEVFLSRWHENLALAIICFSNECGEGCPTSEDENDISLFCLDVIIDKLKPKKKRTVDPRDAIICFASGIDEILKKNAHNTHPYIACIGTPADIASGVVVCDKKVITNNIGGQVMSCLLVLLAVHYAYQLSFNPESKSVMEFFQEMLLGHVESCTRKMTASYSNFVRAINCIQHKIDDERLSEEKQHVSETEPEDDDPTQLPTV